MATRDESRIEPRQSDKPEDHSEPLPPNLRPWSSLETDEKTRLQVAYGQWLDQLPPTCSLETKIARFTAWLEQHGIDYDARHDTRHDARHDTRHLAVTDRT
jgi:hypothetical protein